MFDKSIYQENLTASEALEVALEEVTWRWGQLSKKKRREGRGEETEKGRAMAQPQAGVERQAGIHAPP